MMTEGQALRAQALIHHGLDPRLVDFAWYAGPTGLADFLAAFDGLPDLAALGARIQEMNGAYLTHIAHAIPQTVLAGGEPGPLAYCGTCRTHGGHHRLCPVLSAPLLWEGDQA